MEDKINWREAVLELFEEKIKLKREVRILEMQVKFWKQRAIKNLDMELEDDEGAVECGLDVY